MTRRQGIRRGGRFAWGGVTGLLALSLGVFPASAKDLGAPLSAPSPALLPPAHPAVKDSHAVHNARKIPCLRCHEAAARSSWASQRLVARMSDCAACHEAAGRGGALAPISAACEMCHGRLEGQAPKPGVYPRPNVRFSHLAHRGRVSCGDCHERARAGLSRPAGRRDVPTMRACYECHETQGAGLACRTCHIAQADGRLIQRFGGLVLRPPQWLFGPNHGEGWIGGHAPLAGRDSTLCASCHREQECQDCHTGRRKPARVHDGDWVTRHGINSRLDSTRCRGCHRQQSFCLSCHRRSGVAPDSPAGSRGAVGSGRYHKGQSTRDICRRAKTDIGSCVSCHSEQSCVGCHGVVNPHPPGWKRKCRVYVKRGSRACGKCHIDDPARLCN